MTRPISDRIAAQAVELLASGLGLRTVARQLGVPRTTLRETVARHAGSPAAWSLRRRPPTGNPMGRPPQPPALDLYHRSLGRAWRDRGWSWRRIAAALGVTHPTARRWCR